MWYKYIENILEKQHSGTWYGTFRTKVTVRLLILGESLPYHLLIDDLRMLDDLYLLDDIHLT